MKFLKVIAWLAAFVILLNLFMSAGDSGHGWLAFVIFLIAVFVLGPAYYRMKRRAFVWGYTGKRHPSPVDEAKAENAEKWVGRVETAHRIGEWLK